MPRALRIKPGLEALAYRPGALFPKRQVCGFGKSLLLRVVLDAIELGDQIERLLRDRRGLQRLEEVATDVRQACSAPAARNLLDVVVAAVPVDE